MLDLRIAGGTVIDPARGVDDLADVSIRSGRIVEASPGEAAVDAIEADGCLVVPGLIDLHGHYFDAGFPHGVDADLAGVRAGVTTVVDAGTTGWANFGAFRKLVIDRAETRVLAYLHLCSIGLQTLASGIGELHDLAFADPDATSTCARSHPGTIVGIKVRLARKVSADPWALLDLAREAARSAGLPLMVHVADAPIPFRDVLSLLEPGDVVTHAFHGDAGGLVGPDGSVLEEAFRARERAWFDVGHAGVHCSLDVVQAAAADGFFPDTFGTDVHRPPAGRVVPDVAGVMSTFLDVGMPMADVVAAATSNPAAVLGVAAELGSLAVGSTADVTVLQARPGSHRYGDGVRVDGEGEHLRPVAVVVGGRVHRLDDGAEVAP